MILFYQGLRVFNTIKNKNKNKPVRLTSLRSVNQPLQVQNLTEKNLIKQYLNYLFSYRTQISLQLLIKYV